MVIGILIALQLDTWNEDRKDRAVAAENMEALRAVRIWEQTTRTDL